MVQSLRHYFLRDGYGDEMPEWASLSVQEAAEQTGYSREYLRRLIRYGKLEATRVGRVYLIKAESMNRYLAEMRESDDGRAGPR